MKVVDIEEAVVHLSDLVDEAANGQSFVIARAGKKLLQVVAIDADLRPAKSWFGSIEGQFVVPRSREEFKAIGREEIEEMFALSD